LEIKLRGDADLASSEAQTLAERASDLRELIRQLEAQARKTTPSMKPKPPKPDPVLAPSLKPGRGNNGALAALPPVWHSPTGRFTDSRGQLENPVAGIVLSRFGQSKDPDRTGGIVFQTARRAQIIAPFDGQIAFVGNFRNYGQLLILDVGEGYHMVLSGLAQAYVVKGQSVLAGEPVGKMANRRKPAPEFYLEFRKKGQPFDPSPWLKKAVKAG
jgi:septal ring factor EnvC (AmiA/AmiB activator)